MAWSTSHRYIFIPVTKSKKCNVSEEFTCDANYEIHFVIRMQKLRSSYKCITCTVYMYMHKSKRQNLTDWSSMPCDMHLFGCLDGARLCY